MYASTQALSALASCTRIKVRCPIVPSGPMWTARRGKAWLVDSCNKSVARFSILVKYFAGTCSLKVFRAVGDLMRLLSVAKNLLTLSASLTGTLALSEFHRS